MSLDDVKKKRFEFIHHLYQATGADLTKYVEQNDVGSRLEFSEQETEVVSRYLKDEGLIRWISQQGAIAITHEGVKEVERSLDAPEESTTYFPPAVNIISIEHMEGSQIQQATAGSTQTYISEAHHKQLAEFLELLKKRLPDLELTGDSRAELQADVATIEAQVSSGRPKTGVVKESLFSVRRILESAAAGIAAAELLKYLPALLALL